MATDMHPLRRAQLEAELAQQARNGGAQSSTNELASAASIDNIAMMKSATSANSEPLGSVQRRRQELATRTAPSIAETVKRVPEVVSQGAARKSKETRQDLKKLRKMVKEADEVGDFLHAQKISDELASAEEAFRKRLPPSQNLAKKARKKAARLEREIEARANSTWITPAQERLSRRKANEKRAEADPKWAALKESKKAESKATLKAVRRYAMLREQREHSAYQDEQPSRRAYDQGKQDVPASTFSEQQLGQCPLHQQHSILQSVHPPSREADAEVRSKKRKLESQAEAASRKHRCGVATTRSTAHALGLRLERMDMYDKSSVGASSDDETDSGLEDEGNDFPQLVEKSSAEATPPPSDLPPEPQSADVEKVVGQNMAAFAMDNKPYDASIHGSPRQVPHLMLRKRQTPWAAHGDGSKAFLDPSSTAYKMMSKMGWSQGRGLGKDGAGPKEFIKVSMKRNRQGLKETPANVIAGNDENTGPRYEVSRNGISHPQAESDSTQLVSDNEIDLTAGEDEHHQPNSDSRAFIDLTQDDGHQRVKSFANSNSVVVDLTRDEDDTAAHHNADDMILDIASPSNNSGHPQAWVGSASQASNFWLHTSVLAGRTEYSTELQSVTVDGEEILFVQDFMGDESLAQQSKSFEEFEEDEEDQEEEEDD